MKRIHATMGLIGTISLCALVALSGCSNSEPTTKTTDSAAKPSSADQAVAPPNVIVGTVVETMDAGGYTYVQADAGGQKIWAAGPVTKLAVGDPVELSGRMLMTDFHSKSLDRTFKQIYFVSGFGKATGAGNLPAGHPSVGGDGAMGMSAGHGMSTGSPKADQKMGISIADIAKPEGGKRIAEILAAPKDLAGKTVVVRGVVVKYTPGVMKKNWLHIQDGSGNEKSADLTITTQDKVAYGDTVLVRGTVEIDKDFGYGYKYAVIVEDATVTVE